MDTQPDYASFLIRLWREPHASRDAGWLAQAEFIPSGEQRYFASLDELFEFIRAPLGQTQASRPRSVFNQKS